MTISFYRRAKLGKGSCNGIAHFLKERFGRETDVVLNKKAEADTDIVVRWGCTSNVGENTKVIINKASQIHTVGAKKDSRKILQDAGVKVPKSFFSKHEVAGVLGMCDFIGRPAVHSQGRQSVIVRSIKSLHEDQTSAYWSEVIPKQKEYRVYCFFGKVVAVTEKVPTDPTALIWNVAQNGSIFQNVKWSKWPINVCIEALKTQHTLGIEFTGVDVMEHDGIPYVLEANSAPSLTSPYRQEVMARAFEWLFQHIEDEGNKPEFYELATNVSSYKSLILPFVVESGKTEADKED